ncbi:MAG: hypothetical protein AAFN79_09610 [Pseudomonadota bacterium]
MLIATLETDEPLKAETVVKALDDWRIEMREALEEAANAAKAGHVEAEAMVADVLAKMLPEIAAIAAADPAELAERLGGVDYGDALGWGMGMFADMAEIASGNRAVLDGLGSSGVDIGQRLHDAINDGSRMEGGGGSTIVDMIWFELDTHKDPKSGYTYYIQTDENGPSKTVTDPISGYEYRVHPDPQAEIDRLNSMGEEDPAAEETDATDDEGEPEEYDPDNPPPDEMVAVEVTEVDEFGDEVTYTVMVPKEEVEGADDDDDQLPPDPNMENGAPMTPPDEKDDPTYGLILTDPDRIHGPAPELEDQLGPLILTDPDAHADAIVFTAEVLDPTYGLTQPPLVDEGGGAPVGGVGGGEPIPDGGDVMIEEPVFFDHGDALL